ncbi:MAG TPA: hypothetical protein DET40_05585 [Lentisphaeria bacterium]|nr:MAG: hypothetical protein A2X45_12325 [Lentisphaerae bacterium GWF2_50_93]HCE42998.1 hypothetical protein [Lentisphaeria bacterium]
MKIKFSGENFVTDKKFIESISENDIKGLAEADSKGFLMAPGEDAESYRKRLLVMDESYSEVEKELCSSDSYNIFGEFTIDTSKRISPEILGEAAELTQRYYGFNIDWVPGFFLSKSLGVLWGGCAISFPDQNQLSIFIIRANFAKKKRWLFYRRDELLAHELCHVARVPVRDRTFEELFAYRLSPSPLRRYMGNCFRHDYDAILFILPVFLLLGMQILRLFFGLDQKIPIWPFWILAGIYPLFLMLRNHFNRYIFFSAKTNLEKAGMPEPLPILFRSNGDELKKISSLKDSNELRKWLDEKAGDELRWKVIKFRFFPKNETRSVS